MNLPIEDRYVFAGMMHYTWHGSACRAGQPRPFILAKPNETGDMMRNIVADFGGESPSGAGGILVRSLFAASGKQPAPAAEAGR